MIALTTFYNPSHFKTKKDNYTKFRNNLNIELMTIECAFGEAPFELTSEDADILIQVRSNSTIWQKERLLNIGIKHLPVRYTKFCILDCDLIFMNDKWATQTSELLDEFPVVQPFSYYEKLNQFGQQGDTGISFIKEYYENAKKVSDVYSGHVGYAWAYRRDVIDNIYDKMIVGGGDSIMGYAFVDSNLENWTRNISPPHLQNDIDKWANAVSERVLGKVSYTNGTVRHLWHGDLSNRNYADRQNILIENNFNPSTDLWLNEYNCWETSDIFNSLIAEYFESRKEDG